MPTQASPRPERSSIHVRPAPATRARAARGTGRGRATLKVSSPCSGQNPGRRSCPRTAWRPSSRREPGFHTRAVRVLGETLAGGQKYRERRQSGSVISGAAATGSLALLRPRSNSRPRTNATRPVVSATEMANQRPLGTSAPSRKRTRMVSPDGGGGGEGRGGALRRLDPSRAIGGSESRNTARRRVRMISVPAIW
jgi:hypothetical protein